LDSKKQRQSMILHNLMKKTREWSSI
jgi:hypothetical protein